MGLGASFVLPSSPEEFVFVGLAAVLLSGVSGLESPRGLTLTGRSLCSFGASTLRSRKFASDAGGRSFVDSYSVGAHLDLDTKG